MGKGKPILTPSQKARRAFDLKRWREYKYVGAVTPDYVPDCPNCDQDEAVYPEPIEDTGIFYCTTCRLEFVTITMGGDDEYSCTVEEANEMYDQQTEAEKSGIDIAQEAPIRGVYNPEEMVEEAGEFYAASK